MRIQKELSKSHFGAVGWDTVRPDKKAIPARPKPDRGRYLSVEQVGQLTNAAAFAASLGSPLNAQLTFVWPLVPGFTAGDLPRLQHELLRRFGQWLRRRGVVPRFVWVRERVRGRGLHLHVQTSLPQELVEAAEAFLTAAGGFVDIPPPDAIKGVMISWGSGSHGAWAGLLKYLAKGLDHRDFVYGPHGTTINLGVLLGVQHRGMQGLIAMKRSGVSQNIGPKARAAAGWQEVTDPLDLAYWLNPPKKRNFHA